MRQEVKDLLAYISCVLEKVNELPDPLAKEDKIAIRKTFDLIRLILRGIEDEIF